MKEEVVEYRHEGVTLEAYIAYDEALERPMPGVLISHAWAGRGELECAKARAVAGQGYLGFALDLYGKGVLGSGPEENATLMQPLLDDRALLQERLKVALSVLQGHASIDPSRIAAMGFCFGGLCVLDLARTGANIRGVASFHGLLSAPGNITGGPIHAKVLVLHGHDDPMAPVEQVNELETELTAAGADWQIHTYGNTMHSFTNPKADDPSCGKQYNESADRRSWGALLNFLEEIFV